MTHRPVLAAVDFSDVTAAVVETAEQFACCWDAELLLLHVARPEPDFVGYRAGPDSAREDVAREVREEHRQLEKLVRRLSDHELKVTPLLVQGATVEKVLKMAEDLSAQLIIVGSHGHGAVFHLLVGSVSEGVLRGANCPVVIVPARGLKP